MRILLVVLTLLLAGCTSQAPDASPQTEESNDDAGTASDVADGAGSEPSGTDPLLATVDCPLDDVVVHSPAGLQGTTGANCDLVDIDIPDGARSMRATFTWSAAQAYESMGIKLRDNSECGQTNSEACSLAEGDGGSPVVVDVDSSVLANRNWDDLDIYVAGYAVEPEFDLQLAFFSSESPPAETSSS